MARRSAGDRRRTGWSALPRRASAQGRSQRRARGRSGRPTRARRRGGRWRARPRRRRDRPTVADRPERRPVATRHAESPTFRGIAFPDPLREPAAVGLGLDRLPGPALPLVLVGGQDALVGEQDHRAPGVEVVARVDRGPQVPGEAGHVADDEDLPILAGAGEHLRPLAGRGDRPPRVGHLPGAARVDEAPALDGAGLLLGLGVGPEVVRLARRRLADPARRTAAAEVLEGAGQGADGHATLASRFAFRCLLLGPDRRSGRAHDRPGRAPRPRPTAPAWAQSVHGTARPGPTRRTATASATVPGTVRVRWRVNMGIRGRSPRRDMRTAWT